MKLGEFSLEKCDSARILTKLSGCTYYNITYYKLLIPFLTQSEIDRVLKFKFLKKEHRINFNNFREKSDLQKVHFVKKHELFKRGNDHFQLYGKH